MVEGSDPQRRQEAELRREDVLNGGGGRRAGWGRVLQPDGFIKHSGKQERETIISKSGVWTLGVSFLLGRAGAAALHLFRPLNKLNLFIFRFQMKT